jgi:hypothetical protein
MGTTLSADQFENFKVTLWLVKTCTEKISATVQLPPLARVESIKEILEYGF